MKLDIVTRHLGRMFMPSAVNSLKASTVERVARAIGAEAIVHPASQAPDKPGFAVASDAGVIVAFTGTDIMVEFRAVRSKEQPAFSSFLETAAIVAEQLSDLLPGNAVRLAGVTEGIMSTLTASQMDAIANRLMRFPVGGDDVPWEWDWRSVTSRQRHFAGHDERINTVLTVKRASGSMDGQPIDAVHLVCDINTHAENMSSRFSGADSAAFFRACREWHAATDSALSALIEGEP